jgi:methylenetetrahydrofolate--tRNA-(uracil-5-)-methyltransferase
LERCVTIIGGGLAGSEAAWQAAKTGVRVKLIEMRPQKTTPAHKTDNLAELVCSNSLGSLKLESASGLLKKELEILHSLVMEVALQYRLPAGDALAVDREAFSKAITELISTHPLIQLEHMEVDEFTEITEPLIIATGPLTSQPLMNRIADFVGEDSLYFYDAIAPIVFTDSIDQTKGFWGSRWSQEKGDYFNCTLSQQEYDLFYQALINADQAEKHIPEELKVFEGCMPIEEMAGRGYQTLLYGPMTAKGLKDPQAGKRPFAVIQLRQENKSGTLLGLVGFQTRLKWPEQRRVLSMVPALKDAEYARYGVMHRNSFLNAPRVLLPTFQSRNSENLFFAGQLSGVEGYLESVASGLVAGVNAGRMALNKKPMVPPKNSMIGALAHYITSANPMNFQPMNANFGLLPPLWEKKKMKRRLLQVKQATEAINKWAEDLV